MTESSSSEQHNTDTSGQGTSGTVKPHSGKGPHIVPVTGATSDSGKGPHVSTPGLTENPDSGKGPH
jgi:hypothetical protein